MDVFCIAWEGRVEGGGGGGGLAALQYSVISSSYLRNILQNLAIGCMKHLLSYWNAVDSTWQRHGADDADDDDPADGLLLMVAKKCS